MSTLYQDIIRDHYQSPRHNVLLENADFSVTVTNPSCGDKVTCTGIIKDGVLVEIGFVGVGCVLSIACSSIMTEFVSGSSTGRLKALDNAEFLAVVGMPLGPVRVRCALLGLQAVLQGIAQHNGGDSRVTVG